MILKSWMSKKDVRRERKGKKGEWEGERGKREGGRDRERRTEGGKEE
jgi:hypothetical protein